jgi:hypothetical protein
LKDKRLHSFIKFAAFVCEYACICSRTNVCKHGQLKYLGEVAISTFSVPRASGGAHQTKELEKAPISGCVALAPMLRAISASSFDRLQPKVPGLQLIKASLPLSAESSECEEQRQRALKHLAHVPNTEQRSSGYLLNSLGIKDPERATSSFKTKTLRSPYEQESCPSLIDQQLRLLARGGQPGASAGTGAAATVAIRAMGCCSCALSSGLSTFSPSKARVVPKQSVGGGGGGREGEGCRNSVLGAATGSGGERRAVGVDANGGEDSGLVTVQEERESGANWGFGWSTHGQAKILKKSPLQSDFTW